MYLSYYRVCANACMIPVYVSVGTLTKIMPSHQYRVYSVGCHVDPCYNGDEITHAFNEIPLVTKYFFLSRGLRYNEDLLNVFHTFCSDHEGYLLVCTYTILLVQHFHVHSPVSPCCFHSPVTTMPETKYSRQSSLMSHFCFCLTYQLAHL